MLPNFKKVETDVQKYLLDQMMEKTGPILTQISTITCHEGNEFRPSTDQHELIKTTLERIEAEIVVTKAESQTLTIKDWNEKISRARASLTGQQETLLFSMLEKTVEKTGNVIHGKNMPFKEQILKSLAKVFIDFDEFNRPILPTMHIGEKDFERISKQLADLENDPEFKAEFELLMTKKRDEHNDRELGRALVD